MPSHWAIVALLMGVMSDRKLDFKEVLGLIKIAPNKVRGNAAKGRFGGSKRTDLSMEQRMSEHCEHSLVIPKATYSTALPRKKDVKRQDNEDDTQAGPAPRPFVKWAGGKRQLLDILNAAAPDSFGRYYEPFLGGAAFLFSQLPDSATISDANPELINCYQMIHDDVDALIRSLRTHKNEEAHFYYFTHAKNLSKLTLVQL